MSPLFPPSYHYSISVLIIRMSFNSFYVMHCSNVSNLICVTVTSLGVSNTGGGRGLCNGASRCPHVSQYFIIVSIYISSPVQRRTPSDVPMWKGNTIDDVPLGEVVFLQAIA